MKTIKLLLLALLLASCSTDDSVDECKRITELLKWVSTEQCDYVIKYTYNGQNNSVCVDEETFDYYYELQFDNEYVCYQDNQSKQAATVWTTMCSGGGVWVTKSNHGTYKINGVYCTQQQANDKCIEING